MSKISIKCSGAAILPLDQFEDLQGKLKVLTEENHEKLKQEILTLGFSEPISVWRKKGKKTAFILNGHQRVRVVRKMVEEGHTCDGLPVSLVEADSLQQAKEKVLALTSQYGTMTDEGLTEFMKGAGFTPEMLARFEFPEIDMAQFAAAQQQGEALAGDSKHISFEAYQNAAIKQIVLFFKKDDYDKVLSRFDDLLIKWKLEDHSQVVWKLLNEKN